MGRDSLKLMNVQPRHTLFGSGFNLLLLDSSQTTKRNVKKAVYQGILDPINPDLIKNYLYIADSDKKNKFETQKEDHKKSKEEQYILCMQCENKISRSIYKMSYNGSFDHTFLNPAGNVFHIGCFKRADGCIVLGKASSEWTWFQGKSWRVALCGQCLTHLGWYYQAEDDSPFFGLILDALI